MDCQHRILLETTYHALENGMQDILSGSKTGVYTGSMADDYQLIMLKDIDNIPKHAVTGVAQCMIANRLSWFYNLHGPSINLDSAYGQSFSFDDRANGYSRGEGFSAVLVKRLSDALRDGDTIRAVVRSSGSNQDGHTPGATQPSRDLQARLIEETYEKAGLGIEQTRFFEAHGTGTPLGDPIEADAIGSIFRKVRSKADPLYIGAIKSNIGHLEGGSGLAGIIKTILVLEKGLIPPNANFKTVNPNIDAEFLNIKVSRIKGCLLV
ncbi:hypothetical protein KVR01_012293 [Diaporthe batatas]|uniref:uncharacterized protein n=1 Tax=Diaporthe batatas TaxID=748121 RepID=UPI001D05204F|nr:uncharacterized protein KVR01_012293 [Diaporthe batatas]KAG8158021.1 hypothetical protein KVR01_012293 [Diaporthe batatas]